MANFQIFECPRGTLLETQSMDELVNVDGVFPGHCLVDSRMTLLLTPFFVGAIWLGPPFGKKGLLS